MNKLKQLWSYAMFRWCAYQASLVVIGLLLKGGVFDWYFSTVSYWSSSPGNMPNREVLKKGWNEYELFNWRLNDHTTLIWILIFTLPAVWVWRKPIWKPIWKAIGFLNKKAEEG